MSHTPLHPPRDPRRLAQPADGTSATDHRHPDAPRPHRSRRLSSPWVRRALSLGAMAAVVAVALPRMTGFAEVGQAIGSMSWPIAVLLCLAAAWNLLSYAWVLTAATPGLTFPQAMVVTQSSTAIANAVPGGGAVGVGVTAAMYRSWGFSPSTTSLAVICTGIWNTLVKLGFPLIAFALLLISGGVSTGRLAAALTGLGLVGVTGVGIVCLVRHDGFARGVAGIAERAVSALRRLLRRSPVTGWADAASRFRTDARSLLSGRWSRLTITTLASHASIFAVFYLAVRGVGIPADSVGWIEILGAFSFVRLLSAVPVSPGGLGVVELGLSGALISAGAEPGAAVAGVLLFRTLTYLVPIVAGLPAYVVWRRMAAWRVTAPATGIGPVDVPTGMALA